MKNLHAGDLWLRKMLNFLCLNADFSADVFSMSGRVTDPQNPPGTSLAVPGGCPGRINFFLPLNKKVCVRGISGGKLISVSPPNKNVCSRGGEELIFGPSLNSSLNTIVQGKLFLWSPRTNSNVLGEMDFSLPQTKFLDVSLLSAGKQLRKLLTCPTKQGDIWALQKSV